MIHHVPPAVRTVLLALVAACVVTPRIKTTRIGLPAPARDPGCPLELVQSAAGLEELGEIVVVDEELRPYTDPRLLALVKPEACKLGGEFVSGTSQSMSDGIQQTSRDIYIVWRRKTEPTGSTPF